MNEEKETQYQPRRLSRKKNAAADNFLIKLAIGFVAALLLAQCLLLPEQTRSFLSAVDKMEGEQIPIFTNSKTD